MSKPMACEMSLAPAATRLGEKRAVRARASMAARKHHVAGNHAGARRNPDLVFLLAQRAAGFDVVLVELPREQQREMLLLDPADQLAMGLEHRRNRRHLFFRLDEGIDALRQCGLDHRPKPAQPRTGGLIERIELQPWLEIGREIETHGSAAVARPPSAAAGACSL